MKGETRVFGKSIIHRVVRFVIPAILLLPVSPLAVAQVRVEVKPFPPKSLLQIPPKPDEGYLLLPGRWVWHRPAKMYAWLSPVWVVPPKGKTWSPGYWKSLRKGWIWVPGKWVRKKRFWEKQTG